MIAIGHHTRPTLHIKLRSLKSGRGNKVLNLRQHDRLFLRFSLPYLCQIDFSTEYHMTKEMLTTIKCETHHKMEGACFTIFIHELGSTIKRTCSLLSLARLYL